MSNVPNSGVERINVEGKIKGIVKKRSESFKVEIKWRIFFKKIEESFSQKEK